MAKRRHPRPRAARSSRSGNPAARASVPVAEPAVVRTGFAARPVTDAGVVPPGGVAYPQVLRGESYAWWRSMLGVICGLSLFLLMTSVVSQLVIALGWTVGGGGRPFPDYFADAYAFRLPVGMLAVNLGIATLIPISWLLVSVVHQVRPRWLSSVQPGIRWRYLLTCLAVALVALNGVLALSMLVAPATTWAVQPGFWGFLIVILLTSPLQAVAEEYFFRGYLMQALGSLVARPEFGVIVSAVIFAFLHGTQNLPLFLDRLAFGLLAAILVWRTGGLEAGIAAHVVNNVFAYVLAGLTTSIATVRAISGIGWLDAAFDVGGFAVFAGLAWLVATRVDLRRTVVPAVVTPLT